MRLNSRAFLESAANDAHIKDTWLEGEREPDRAHRQSGSPLNAAIVAGQGSLARGRCNTLARFFGNRLLCQAASATAPLPSGLRSRRW